MLAPMRDLLSTIGNTPMVELPRLAPAPRIRALRQAGGREPDRIGQGPDRARMLVGARASGALQPGQTILEPRRGTPGSASPGSVG